MMHIICMYINQELPLVTEIFLTINIASALLPQALAEVEVDVQEVAVVQTAQITRQVVDAQAVLRVAHQVAKRPAKVVASMGVILFAVDNVDTHVAVPVLMFQREAVVRHQHVLVLVLPIVIPHVQWLVVQVASHSAFMDLSNLNTL